MPQTTYRRDLAGVFAGCPGDTGFARDESFENAEGSAIPAGIGVVETATAGQADLPDAADDVVTGIVVLSEANARAGGGTFAALTGEDAYRANESFPLRTHGSVWVLPEQAVAAGDPVYCRHTSDGGSNTQLGKFRKDADSGKASLVAGAYWQSAGDSDECAQLYFDRNAAKAGRASDSAELSFDHVAVTADTTWKLWKNRSDRAFKIESVDYINVTGLAQDASNYFTMKVLNAAAVAASRDSLTGSSGSITADTFLAMTLSATPADLIVLPSGVVSLMADETGTASLPAGRVVIHGRYL